MDTTLRPASNSTPSIPAYWMKPSFWNPAITRSPMVALSIPNSRRGT
ncbi:hypothetical protein [Nocardia lijiangensis]|nr:hypothetical protein [Nocardia lijiangensis]